MERLTLKDVDGRWNLNFATYDIVVPSRIVEKFSIAITRLASYEDTGLTPEEIMELIAPPNPPLTLEELLEMKLHPVWVERHDFGLSQFAIVRDTENLQFVSFLTVNGGVRLPCSVYGRNWLAYRSKPEEGKA